MKESRRKQIESLIAKNQRVTMEELQQKFDVSMNTIRGDVAYLVSTGAVEKIYGGVRTVAQTEVPLFANRAAQNLEHKRRIAAYAQTLISDRDIIYIDAGTTTMHLIEYLDPVKQVTIVTPNINIIQHIFDHPNVELILLPGNVNRRTNATSDVSTLEYLSRYQYNKAFMGVSTVSERGQLNVSSYIEYELKRTAVQQSRTSYLLVDSSKFGQNGLMSYGKLENMAEVITDNHCPDFIIEYCGNTRTALKIV